MDKVMVPAREVPVLCEADVVVAGGGVGGVCAAVAAARAGAQVTVIERNAYAGGVATAALMCSITNQLVTHSGEQVTFGLAVELLDRLVSEGGAMPWYGRSGQPQIPNDPEALKRVLAQMLAEAGVSSLYCSFVSQPLLQGDSVEAVVCESQAGPFAARASQFVDATGDLSLLAAAGGPCDMAPGNCTLLFRMAGVDFDAIIDWMEAHPDSYSPDKDIPTSLQDTVRNWREFGVLHLPHYAGRGIELIEQALQSGALPDTHGLHIRDLWALGLYGSRAVPGVVLVNSNACNGVEFDVEARSRCEEEGRFAAKVVADFLRAHFPGFADAFLLDTAAELGIRHARRLRGKCTLTRENHRTGRRFPDSVGRTTGVDRTGEHPTRYACGGEVPFGCLVADRPGNVVCGSGKSASTDPVGLLRGQVGCMVVGQAAGAAAGLAALHGVPVRDLDTEDLRRHLAAQGVEC